MLSKSRKKNIFKNHKTGKTCKIFHQWTCKSQAIFCLFQCRIYFKHYFGKSETAFFVRLNNHRKDSKKKGVILACTRFQNLNHIFQWDTKFILIEKITKIYNTIEECRFILKKREIFWISNLCTLYPDGLNKELNDVW